MVDIITKTQEQIIEDVIHCTILQHNCFYSKEEAMEVIDHCQGYKEMESSINEAKDVVVNLRQAGFIIIPSPDVSEGE